MFAEHSVPGCVLKEAVDSIQRLFNAAHQQDLHSAAAVGWVCLTPDVLGAALLILLNHQKLSVIDRFIHSFINSFIQ